MVVLDENAMTTASFYTLLFYAPVPLPHPKCLVIWDYASRITGRLNSGSAGTYVS